MINRNTKFSKKEDILASVIDSEIVLYTLDHGVYFAINETGKLIWDALDDCRTISEVVQYLSEKHEFSEADITEDVCAFFEILSDKKLICQNH